MVVNKQVVFPLRLRSSSCTDKYIDLGQSSLIVGIEEKTSRNSLVDIKIISSIQTKSHLFVDNIICSRQDSWRRAAKRVELLPQLRHQDQVLLVKEMIFLP